MSSSAGNGIGVFLLCDGRLFRGIAEKGCERRNFVRRALNAEDRGAVDVKCVAQRLRQLRYVVDIYRLQARKHRGQAGAESTRSKAVVAVAVAVEQLLACHTHRVRMVVE